MRSDVAVFVVPATEGQSFVLFERDALAGDCMREPWSSIEDVMLRMHRHVLDVFKDAPRLSEPALRAALEARGFDSNDIDAQIRRARNAPHISSTMATVYERTTRLGATNEHGQIVVRKSVVIPIKAEDWLYTLRCSVCGTDHEATAVEVHRTHCPHADRHGS